MLIMSPKAMMIIASQSRIDSRRPKGYGQWSRNLVFTGVGQHVLPAITMDLEWTLELFSSRILPLSSICRDRDKGLSQLFPPL